MERIGRDLLIAIGEDPNRPGLIETPKRFARWWQEFINYQAGTLDTSFERMGQTNQMVVVSGMRVWSICEHHLLPFWADISIGYIAKDKVLGLSKFARIAHKFAHRPQIQEQLVQQIADEIVSLTHSEDVAVMASGVHLCMVMRGIKTEGTMTSSIMRGAFLYSESARQEFLQIVQQTR